MDAIKEWMVPEGFACGHTIPRGLVYMAVPDVAERLRLQSWMTGDYS